jgi:hypothetical protein
MSVNRLAEGFLLLPDVAGEKTAHFSFQPSR